MPKISIILPVYNAASSIKAAIESLLNQFFADFELIIIDDGSTDNSVSIINNIQDKRIKLIKFDQNQGIVAALNAGIEASTTQFIARMDADDTCAPNRLALQYDYLLQHDEIDVVSCLVAHGGNENTQAGYRYHIDWINTKLSHDEITKAIYTESPICHPSVMIRKSVFEQHGTYKQGHFPEDYELWMRWMHQGVRFAKLPEVLYTWNDPINRLSRIQEAYSEEAFYATKVKYLKSVFSKLDPRPIYVWGYSKKVIAKTSILEQHGFEIAAYIDIKATDSQKRKVIYYKTIADFKQIRILSLLPMRNGGHQVNEFLISKGLIQNEDYFLLS